MKGLAWWEAWTYVRANTDTSPSAMRLSYFVGPTVRARRNVFRARRFAISVIGCWTFGIAAAIMTYTIADAYFFRPPAFVTEPEMVLRLYAKVPNGGGQPLAITQFSVTYLDALEKSGLAGRVAGVNNDEQDVWCGNTDAMLHVASVSRHYFTIMGVRPHRGRVFTGEPAQDGTALPLLLSERAWNRCFGSTAGPTGQSVRIRDRDFAVVGTLPEGFTGGASEMPDVWVPLDIAGPILRGEKWHSANTWWLTIVVRRASGMAVQRLEALSLVALSHELVNKRDTALLPTVMVAAPLRPGATASLSPVGRAMTLVSAAGLALLLIASVNVGGLFLLRGLARHRDLLVCRALGATTGTLAAEVLAEVIVLLVMATALAALLVALFGKLMLSSIIPDTSLLIGTFRFRTAVIGGAAGMIGLIICGGIAVGSIAAERAGMPSGMDRSASGRSKHLLRAIIAGQAAVTALLVAGAILLAMSLANLRSLNLGIDISDVTLVSVGRGYVKDDPHRTEALLNRVASRVLRQPYVESASLAISAPFKRSIGVAVNAPDHPAVWQTLAGVPYLNAVSVSYFSTTGMKPQEGRLFSNADSIKNARVAVVNETFANVLRAEREPLGRCIVLGADLKEPCFEIVGIVPDARRFTLVPEEASLQLYILSSVNPFANIYPPAILLVKSAKGQREAVSNISRVVREEGQYADVSVTSLEELVDPQIRPWRYSGRIWAVFAMVATCLTCVGVYAAIAYAMEQRRREIAIRRALGATSQRLLKELGLSSIVTCTLGIAAGCLAVIVAQHRGLLAFDSLSYSPAIVFAAGALVVCVITVATSLPILRMANRPPAMFLRE